MRRGGLWPSHRETASERNVERPGVAGRSPAHRALFLEPLLELREIRKRRQVVPQLEGHLLRAPNVYTDLLEDDRGRERLPGARSMWTRNGSSIASSSTASCLACSSSTRMYCAMRSSASDSGFAAPSTRSSLSCSSSRASRSAGLVRGVDLSHQHRLAIALRGIGLTIWMHEQRELAVDLLHGLVRVARLLGALLLGGDLFGRPLAPCSALFVGLGLLPLPASSSP